jgi:predicted RNA-binding protein associated with RNAse of E/G family
MVTPTPCGTASGFPTVHIHYRRPPDRLTVYRQALIHEDAHVKITLARNLALAAPVYAGGSEGAGGSESAGGNGGAGGNVPEGGRPEPILEPGSDVVWFTYPGAWHDVGRFYRADGRFTGLYANMLTPCVFQPGHDWETTDLFLDVWLPASGGPPRLLDQEELAAAEAAGLLRARWAERARSEADRLMAAWEAGVWPAPEVHQWTRERALALYNGRAV